ncbi:MAG: protein-export chaperone SecB [Dysgonamonadaceae bacterium]|nr:protein-export chaperone SecB [Dysgonamonadaceae bacterium]MDD4729308.1 protein-export chaperone SecB [Dysgonamonadaceae bacterium]
MKPKVQNKIRLDRFFVEQLKYECSNYNKFNESDQVDIELSVGTSFSDDDLKSYLVKMTVRITAKTDDFILECDAVGRFVTTEEVDDDFKNSHFVTINSPAILYPFVRGYINTITTNSGITPIILPSVNFSSQEKD